MFHTGPANVIESSAPAASARYGVLKYGAPWAEARALLICVHGRDRQPDELPALVASMNDVAPFAILAPYIDGRSWYSGKYDAPYAKNAADIGAATSAIRDAMTLAAKFGFKDRHIVLAGFSQGGCLVAEYLMADNPQPRAAAIFTGAWPDLHNRAAPSNRLNGMEVLVSGGNEDPWLPVSDLKKTTDLLERAGAQVKFTQFSDGEHVVRPSEIAALGGLLKKVVA